MTAAQILSTENVELIKSLKAGEQMIFPTYEDAQDAFYMVNSCESDDPDNEGYRIEQWVEGNKHIILESL